MTRIPKFLREPLVLFTLTAASVFGLHALTVPDPTPTIEVTAEALASAVDNRALQLGRSLSEAEQGDLLGQLVNQELLVREAVARGFPLHDSKTRARMVTQMYFVLGDDAPEPTRADLADLLSRDRDRYMIPQTVTFDHVFFENQAPAQALMTRITAGEAMPQDPGDRFWLGNHLEYYAAEQIAATFGTGFATQLPDLRPDVWAGPVRSAKGWHLVRLDAVNPPRPLPQEELDWRLRADWKEAFHAASIAARLDEMRQDYRIVLPAPSDASPKVATLGEADR